MAQRSTRRTESFSAARLSDILPGSYLLSEQSPGSSHRVRIGIPNARQVIVKENLPVVKEVFSVFDKFFLRNFRAFYENSGGGGKVSPSLPQIRADPTFGPDPGAFRAVFSRRRPSRCRWYTSRRRRGRCPRCRTAGAACSGWKRRPAPSSSARTPACRTTWCGRSRPGRRPSP